MRKLKTVAVYKSVAISRARTEKRGRGGRDIYIQKTEIKELKVQY